MIMVIIIDHYIILDHIIYIIHNRPHRIIFPNYYSLPTNRTLILLRMPIGIASNNNKEHLGGLVS